MTSEPARPQSHIAIVHALRGWPTPLGVIVNTADKIFDPEGQLNDEKVRAIVPCAF